MPDSTLLPPHIEQTIAAIADLHRDHRRRATPSQLAVAKLKALASRPRFVGALTTVFVLWIGLNGFAKLAGYSPPDPPPFSYMQAVTGVAGVYITLLILITQRHENQLAEAHEQLALDLAILNEQRSAKTIALLEEMRRDLPNLPNRSDPEAERLGQAADPQEVLEAFRSSTDDSSATVSDTENGGD